LEERTIAIRDKLVLVPQSSSITTVIRDFAKGQISSPVSVERRIQVLSKDIRSIFTLLAVWKFNHILGRIQNGIWMNLSDWIAMSIELAAFHCS
jgi:hypothetical protein